jgi:hypothetical protein
MFNIFGNSPAPNPLTLFLLTHLEIKIKKSKNTKRGIEAGLHQNVLEANKIESSKLHQFK